MEEKPKRKWAGTTMGNEWMHETLIKILRHVDVRIIYIFTFLFVIPVCIVMLPSKKTAYRYFRQRQGFGRFHSAWATYKNHCLFATNVIDKFAMYAGKKFDVKMEGFEQFKELDSREEGFVQLSSHIGNFEIAGYSLSTERKTMHALVFGGEKASVMRERDKKLETHRISLIPTREDMSHIFEMNNALSNGDIVSMPGDRIVGSTKTVDVNLLGAKAKLPIGPFLTPTMRGLDAIAINVMKTSAKSYTIYFNKLEYDHTANRNEKIRQLAEKYTLELEKMLKQYPEQWYNFYEFWD